MSRLILRFIRPNTIGVTKEMEFDCYADAENTIEDRCESLANRGWEISELSGSSSESGAIECTHDDEADILLIAWETK